MPARLLEPRNTLASRDGGVAEKQECDTSHLSLGNATSLEARMVAGGQGYEALKVEDQATTLGLRSLTTGSRIVT